MIVLTAAGCQSTSPPAQSGRPVVSAPGAVSPAGTSAAATDPCAVRMQDLCGPMLEYYMLNKQLPLKLADLQAFADEGAGGSLNFTCPVSGDPYVYVPKGLIGEGLRDRLVLYDAKSVHEVGRWGIVMSAAKLGKPVMMYVIPVSDQLLKAYGGE